MAKYFINKNSLKKSMELIVKYIKTIKTDIASLQQSTGVANSDSTIEYSTYNTKNRSVVTTKANKSNLNTVIKNSTLQLATAISEIDQKPEIGTDYAENWYGTIQTNSSTNENKVVLKQFINTEATTVTVYPRYEIDGKIYKTIFAPSTAKNFIGVFNSKSNLTSVEFKPGIDCSEMTTMKDMFYLCKNLVSIKGLEYLNTSKVTDMSNMFSCCYKLTYLNVSSFNTRNVTNMYSMFNQCIALTELDLTSFDTSKVTNMSNMFAYCSKLSLIDISNFDMSNVTNIISMFYFCGNNGASFNIGKFDVSSVINFYNAFYNCFLAGSSQTLTKLESFNHFENIINTHYFIFKNSIPTNGTNYGILNSSDRQAALIKDIFGFEKSELDSSVINNLKFDFKIYTVGSSTAAATVYIPDGCTKITLVCESLTATSNKNKAIYQYIVYPAFNVTGETIKITANTGGLSNTYGTISVSNGDIVLKSVKAYQITAYVEYDSY